MAAPEGYNALGKIGISYKGEYASNTAYERLDAVAHNGSTYLAIKDAPDGAPRDDKLNWIYLAKGFSGDIGDSEIAFTEAENRENINTGESVKTVFGKIKKFFADLTAPAFAQMITSKDDLLATKATGYVPDAKAVADAVTDVTGKLPQLKVLKIPLGVKTTLNPGIFSLLFPTKKEGYTPIAIKSWALFNRDWADNIHINGVVTDQNVLINGKISGSNQIIIPSDAFVEVLYLVN